MIIHKIPPLCIFISGIILFGRVPGEPRCHAFSYIAESNTVFAVSITESLKNAAAPQMTGFNQGAVEIPKYNAHSVSSKPKFKLKPTFYSSIRSFSRSMFMNLSTSCAAFSGVTS